MILRRLTDLSYYRAKMSWTVRDCDSNLMIFSIKTVFWWEPEDHLQQITEILKHKSQVGGLAINDAEFLKAWDGFLSIAEKFQFHFWTSRSEVLCPAGIKIREMWIILWFLITKWYFRNTTNKFLGLLVWYLFSFIQIYFFKFPQAVVMANVNSISIWPQTMSDFPCHLKHLQRKHME